MTTMNSSLGGQSGYGENSFKTNGVDQGSSSGIYDDSAVRLDLTSVFGPDGIEFFGDNYTEMWVNSNGLLTFESPDTSYQPEGLSGLDQPAIAPFWSDIDIDKGGDIYWDVDPDSGKITITWLDVAPYNGAAATNSFQVVLSNLGDGEFSIDFIYEDLSWVDGGFGVATAGVTDGGTEDFEVPGSGDATQVNDWENGEFGGGEESTTGVFTLIVADGLPKLSVEGTAGDDVLGEGFVDGDGGTISEDGDEIDAGAGNDQVDGGAGSDTIIGGSGNDVLSGGAASAVEWEVLEDRANITADGTSNYFTFNPEDGGRATIRFNDSTGFADGDGVADYLRIESTADNVKIYIGDFDVGTDKIVLPEMYESISSGSLLGTYNITITFENGNEQSYYIYMGDEQFDPADLFTTVEPATYNDEDVLDGGDDADTFLIGDNFGSDTIIGGEGTSTGLDEDTVDASSLSVAVVVTYLGDGFGEMSAESDMLSFSQIEALNLTNLADSVDASADAAGATITAGDGADTVLGGSGADVLDGGEGADRLVGGLGDDSISGGAGADFLKTGQGQDTLDGGDGADTLMNAAGDDSLVGGAGDDLIVATQGNDTLEGGTGADTLMGGTDNDSLDGGADNDLLLGDLAGVEFNPTLTNGVGLASNITDFPTTQITYELTFASTDTGGDTSLGSYAVAGQDNEFSLQLQSDSLAIYVGGSFTDTGIPAATFLDGNLNTLAVTWDSATGGLEVFVNGVSSYTGTTATGDTLETGGTFALGQDQDTVGGGFDAPQAFEGTIYGVRLYDDIRTPAEILDTVQGPIADTSDPNLIANWVADPDSATFTDQTGSHAMAMSGDLSATWSSGADTLYGDLGDDTLYGGGGDDILDGWDGSDLIYGGAGNDTVLSGFFAAGGEDSYFGGEGIDTFDILNSVTSTFSYTINLETGVGSYGNTYSGFERILGGDGNDAFTAGNVMNVELQGNGGNDTLTGGAGGDTLSGGAGDDLISGGDGDDLLTTGTGQDTLFGGAGNDTLMNSAGDDSLDGGAGDDSMVATDGNDTLRGGTGADTMEGGNDADTFIIEDSFGNDVITGGEGTSGAGPDSDVIDLSAMTGPVTVTYTGDEQGTITDGTDTITFSEIEQIITTDQADVVDASGQVGTTGINVDTRDGDDTVTGSNNADTIVAGAGMDSVDAGSGADSVDGGTGNDTITGADGSDTLRGGAGEDSLDGGENGDSLFGDDGNDTILGGGGADTIDGGTGADSIDAGDGNDYVDYALGGDTVYGGTGNDTLLGGFSAGSDDAELHGGDGDDRIVTYGANDTVFGDAGNDTIIADSGNESLDGGADDDVIWANSGNDTVSGGSGNDTIDGGTGDDSISGGDGDDVFVYSTGDGADTITDFNFGNTGALGDGDTSNNDFIDLSQYYTNLVELRADFDDDGVLNQSTGDFTDNTDMAGGDSLTFSGADRQSFTADNTGVVCFAEGTMILTPSGEMPVESLRPGDLVVTKDNGPQPLLMSACRSLSQKDLIQNPKLRPIELKAGLFGIDQRLVVSPQHAILVQQGGDEVLVRARHLARLQGGLAREMQSVRRVTYWHLVFGGHQIVFSNGHPTESLFPGPFALAGMSDEARQEFIDLFPEFAMGGRNSKGMWKPARSILSPKSLPPRQKDLYAGKSTWV